jgi:hypothetical protein
MYYCYGSTYICVPLIDKHPRAEQTAKRRTSLAGTYVMYIHHPHMEKRKKHLIFLTKRLTFHNDRFYGVV